MTQGSQSGVYTIPAAVAFMPALVKSILEGRLVDGMAGPTDPVALSKLTILLPTRRAVRACREAFVDLQPEKALLLPIIRSLGDVDEDEFIIRGTAGINADIEMALPPAAGQLQRQFMLAKLITDWAHKNPHGAAAQAINDSTNHALGLAASLVQLIDSVEMGDIELGSIPEKLLSDPELPMHRSEALDFLSIICIQYPQAMQQAGVIGPQERRSRLLKLLADTYSNTPPDAPVIAAGSTGSVPATAGLLAAISKLPNGAVVLPGLDTDLDDESWAAITDSPQHPQFGMKELLDTMGVEREDVSLLPGVVEDKRVKARAILASEIMRPSTMTHLWQSLRDKSAQLATACEGVSELVCPEMREQALAIALIMRKANDENRECALVTSDRQLAKRVVSELSRWNIQADDSAGEALAGLEPAVFLQLVTKVSAPTMSLHDLVTLLAHPMMRQDLLSGHQTHELAQLLELAVLRPTLGEPSLEELEAHVSKARFLAEQPFAHPTVKAVTREQWSVLVKFAAHIRTVFEPLLALVQQGAPAPLSGLLHSHIGVAEALCSTGEDGAHELWRGEAGAALSETLRELLDHASEAPAMTLPEYEMFLSSALKSVSVRRRYPLNSRLKILGLLEARLVQSELVIMGGVNEGTWPSDMDPGPWLSRPQHRLAGLQLPERRLGLAAHDFVQALGAKQVIITWASKVAGTPAIASRWLRRMKAVLEGAGLQNALTKPHSEDWLGWSLGLDWHEGLAASDMPERINRPPNPTPVKRPKQYSVSRIEKLMHDPYQVYADAILKLKPLDPLNKQPGPAERGQIVHAVMEQFIKRYPDEVPQNTKEVIGELAVQILPHYVADPALRALWLPQIMRMGEWFCEREQTLRENVARQLTECSGTYSLDLSGTEVSITARADRIDVFEDGTLRIVDYKTGNTQLRNHTTKSYKPQLFLEGLIAQSGSFENVGSGQVADLVYVNLSGGDPAGQLNRLGDQKKFPLAGEIDVVADGVERLIGGYLVPEQGFPAKPGAEAWNRNSDYDHLSRWREWGFGADVDGQEGDSE